MSGRFVKGQSGNPQGRPRKRRPHVSAFDIVFDKTLAVTQNGEERELTVDEALQLRTYQAALKGSRLAIRAVVKMIEKREAALRKSAPKPPPHRSRSMRVHYGARNADAALLLLGIAVPDPQWAEPDPDRQRLKLANWAVQAAISRAGRRPIASRHLPTIECSTVEPKALLWPNGEKR